MRTVVIHALHYYPSTRPVCQLYLDLIKSMMARNYQVIVITAKNGQVAKSVYGETIIYVNNFGFLNERTIFRFLDYISFYSMSLFIASKYLLIYGRPRGVVINVVKSGYGISTFIAMVYKKLYTLNIVFWVLDRYPDIIFQNIKKYNILFKLLKYIEIYSLNNMNKVVFETENDRQDYMNWNGSSEPILIRTWSSIDGEILHYSKPQFWDELDLKNKNIIIYSGNIGFSFDQDKLIKLANSYKDIIFIILGNGSEYQKLYNNIKSSNTNNIIIKKYLPNNEYYYAINNSKYGLVLLKDGLDVFSSKITTYLSFNKPVIGAIDKSNEMYNLINNNCGVVLSEEYPRIPISGIEYEKYVNNSRITKKLYSKNYNTNRFIKVLAS